MEMEVVSLSDDKNVDVWWEEYARGRAKERAANWSLASSLRAAELSVALLGSFIVPVRYATDLVWLALGKSDDERRENARVMCEIIDSSMSDGGWKRRLYDLSLERPEAFERVALWVEVWMGIEAWHVYEFFKQNYLGGVCGG